METQDLWIYSIHQRKVQVEERDIEEVTVMTEKVILKSRERGEAAAEKNIGKAGVGAEIKEEKGEVGVEIVIEIGTEGAEVGKGTGTEVGGIRAKAETETEVRREESEGTEIILGKEEVGQGMRVQAPVMTEDIAVQEVERGIRRLQKERESSQ